MVPLVDGGGELREQPGEVIAGHELEALRGANLHRQVRGQSVEKRRRHTELRRRINGIDAGQQDLVSR